MGVVSEINNYEIKRKIGEGAFGKVFLVEHKINKSFFALKILDKSLQEREINAFEKFKKITANENFIKIIDFGFVDSCFYYVMPLADTLENSANFPPTDFRWQEKSLAKEISRRMEIPSLNYFTVDEILDIISGVFNAVIALGENSLMHRDIKPENILFVNGSAVLSDFGLLQYDRKSISRIGTPLYFAPSWYLNSGGSADIYGLVTTFYSLITGDLPDTIGRLAYRFPVKIKDNITKEIEEQYHHWHRCILRAISENPADRYVQLRDFRDAVFSKDFETSKEYTDDCISTNKPKKSLAKIYILISICSVLLLYLLFVYNNQPQPIQYVKAQSKDELQIDESMLEQISKNGYEKSSYTILSKAQWRATKQNVLNKFIADLEEQEVIIKENKNKLPLETAEDLKNYNISNSHLYKKKVLDVDSIRESILIINKSLESDEEYNQYVKYSISQIQISLKNKDAYEYFSNSRKLNLEKLEKRINGE